jgi:acetyl-CoA C-acetyltransferase
MEFCMQDAVIVGALRTPLGKFRGSLASLEVPDLAAIPLKAVVEKAGIEPDRIDDVVMGNLFGSDWGNPARVAVLRAGFPFSVPAITIDRQCSSGLNALAIAAVLIQTGSCDTVVAAGTESYSQQPF